MFNKVKSIFGKNSKRLKSVLASVLIGVGYTGTSFAKPKSVNSGTEKQEIGGNKDSVNTYDFAEVMKTAKDNKGKIELTLSAIMSIFGYKKVEPMVSDYMDIRAIRKAISKIDVHEASDKEIKDALDKIRDVNKVSNKVLGIAGNIIEKYLKIGKRKKIIGNAAKKKEKAFHEANGKGVDFDNKESEGYKKFISTTQLVDKTKEQELSKLQLSADEWFTKLGGTQEDIDGYREPDLSKINKNTEKQIQKDVPRSDIGQKCTNYDQKIALLGEILKKFEVEEFQGYMQGYNFIASVVIKKFTENDKKMGEGEQFSKEKKAKIYYVFKKIVQTMVNYSIGKNGIDDNNWSQILKRLYDRMLLSFCKRNSVNEIDKCLFLSEFRDGVVCPAICSLFLTSESQIFLWDSIISEVKDGKFDPNLALEKLFDVWFARALQLQEDFYNNKDLNDKSIVVLCSFMRNNPI